MKKLICAILCIVMLLGMAIPALAADDVIVFAADSKFEAGGTATVDQMKTRQAIMDLGRNAAEYNAALEGNVEYIWYRNGLSWGYEPSFTFTEDDKGCEFQCAVYLYEDAELSTQCGIYRSQKFTIPNTGNPALIPEITTENIPNGTVGENYYFKLECTDADVVFDLYQSSLPDGMYITQHGEIEGIPTKAGFYHINVIATPVEFGEDYATMKSFEFTIEEGQQYSLEIMQVPNKVTYYAGEKLDMTGLRVRVYTPDGFFDSKDGDKLTYSKKTLVTLGEQKIKVSYQDAFEFFIVTVLEAPATTPTTSTEQTEEATEVITEDATVDVTENTEPSDLTVGAAPTEEELPEMLDGPGSEGPSNPNGAWIVWFVVGICAVLIVAVAVVIILIVVKRKKAK